MDTGVPAPHPLGPVVSLGVYLGGFDLLFVAIAALYFSRRDFKSWGTDPRDGWKRAPTS